uniref:Secreted protein n=1 Tax=Steinernema glaseri TaxID=37863 RepID=A0A1I7ZV03_9BILA
MKKATWVLPNCADSTRRALFVSGWSPCHSTPTMSDCAVNKKGTQDRQMGLKIDGQPHRPRTTLFDLCFVQVRRRTNRTRAAAVRFRNVHSKRAQYDVANRRGQRPRRALGLMLVEPLPGTRRSASFQNPNKCALFNSLQLSHVLSHVTCARPFWRLIPRLLIY